MQLGIIQISKELLEGDIELLKSLWSKYPPIRSFNTFNSLGESFICRSEEFKNCKEGEPIPVYIVDIKIKDCEFIFTLCGTKE